MSADLTTRIATSDETSITWRDLDLVNDLLGKHSFVEVLYLLICGRMPTATQTRVLDASLITLMEHGMTPHAIVSRLVADCNPTQVQIAMAAGLTCTGDVFAGTMDGCGRILEAGLKESDRNAYAARVVADHRARRAPMPGFGHNLHKPDDPRSPRLIAIAREAGVKGDAIDLLETLAAEVDKAYGRHLTINATGALAALLLEIDIPVSVMRCLSVTSRAAGLSAHIGEELETKSGRRIWHLVEDSFTYVPAS